MLSLEEKHHAILRLLRDRTKPLISSEIGKRLNASGYSLSDRTVRLYLSQLEQQELVRRLGRRGVLITDKGSATLRASQASRRVGFLSARIDEITYRMDFNLTSKTGTLPVNLSLIEPKLLLKHLPNIEKVFAKGYAVGERVGLLAPGQSLGETHIPEDKVGFCTVCSIAVNGVLLQHGIPTRSRFGGLLALRKKEVEHFVELIEYEGTSIDPLEVFIRSGMTDYLGAIHDGTGLIGASFREYPATGRETIVEISKQLTAMDLHAFMEIGYPGCPVRGVPVSEGRIGAILIGGLNPVAILEEQGFRIDSRALHALFKYEDMIHFSSLRDEIKQIVS